MSQYKMGPVSDVKKLGHALIMRWFIKDDQTTAVDSNVITPPTLDRVLAYLSIYTWE